ncbi:MAG: hypothetical protein KAS32_15095 [Candidatus Peribacteraceae bacterium]|nr:hypothetical protein [Candidatus Peribacteraceae bacterium]
MSQKEKIKELLEQGFQISPRDVYFDKDIRSMNLAQRIADLRLQGMEIETIMVDGHAEYKLNLEQQREIFV